jgi:hypothetical protein
VSSATAAGAAASSAGAVPRASSTQDPLAGLTATDIEVKVFDNFKAATSLKWDGTLTEQGEATYSDVALTSQRQYVIDGTGYPGVLESCAGTARFTSSDGKDALGSYRFSLRPSDVYVSPDATYWSRSHGSGEAYASSGYVVTNELGATVRPDWYSDEFHRLRESTSIARITLRNSRATANTHMADAGVPDHIRAAWCGHGLSNERSPDQ